MSVPGNHSIARIKKFSDCSRCEMWRIKVGRRGDSRRSLRSLQAGRFGWHQGPVRGGTAITVGVSEELFQMADQRPASRISSSSRCACDRTALESDAMTPRRGSGPPGAGVHLLEEVEEFVQLTRERDARGPSA